VPKLFSFLHRRQAVILTAVLLAQAALLFGFQRTEIIPDHKELRQLAPVLGAWAGSKDITLDKETLDVLRADDTLNRNYVDFSTQRSANLFVAFFSSQRAGQAPHSPKNCLPGSGWTPSVSDIINVDVPGRDALEVNRYIVQKGESQSLVIYWYQSRDRVVASEYKAKYFVVADALRYNRTDTALVRVVVPVIGGNSDRAMATATDFIRTVYGPLRQHFPS